MSKFFRLFSTSLLAAGLAAPLLAADNPADEERWRQIRTAVFGDRPIAADATNIVRLEAPARAADGAVVPVAIRTQLAQTPQRHIRKLWLVVDKNPSPVGAVFTMTPESGRAEVETRIRVEEYTHARVVAELNDGSLHMHTRFIKAAGGCSAPAGKDAEEAARTLGRTKLRIEGDVQPGQPLLAQLMVSHPQTSGLAIDQLTRLAPVPHFVKQIKVSYGGKPVLTLDADFTISENPSLRFYFTPAASGELKAEIVDTEDRRFESALVLRAGQRPDV